jgi:hypothetical protein
LRILRRPQFPKWEIAAHIGGEPSRGTMRLAPKLFGVFVKSALKKGCKK